MLMDEHYRRQVALLMQTLPLLETEPCFALKGGTAINLFVRDMPRLSVDIDLTYLPVQGRPESLVGIDAALQRLASVVRQRIRGSTVQPGTLAPEGTVDRLLVRAAGVQIKVEVSPVLRGTVRAANVVGVSPSVEEMFGFAEAQLVSFDDLYAGKLVAALDRQHPRDLFDVRDLLAAEGLTDGLRETFVIYLISANRPAVELLDPTRHDIGDVFENHFRGMTRDPVTLAELLEARERLIAGLVGDMPIRHRQFLVSFERGDHDWGALALEGIEALPAVRWKLHNLGQLPDDRRARQADALAKLFERS